MRIARITKHIFLLIASLLFLSGCAFTPQHTDVNPEIHISDIDVGHGHTLALRVDDQRPSQAIGRRGTGAMEGAEIIPTKDVAEVFYEKISDGLKQRGFNVVAYSDAQPIRMVVELRELKYHTSMGFFTGGVHMDAAMKVEAFNNNDNFEQFYRTNKEDRVFFVNFAEENDAIINAAASELLQQFFDDQKLSMFLSK